MFPVTFTDILRDKFGITDPYTLDNSQPEKVQYFQRLLLSTENKFYKDLLLEGDSLVRKFIQVASASEEYNIIDLKTTITQMHEQDS